MTHHTGGYIPGTPAFMTLHPDECVITAANARAGRTVCSRPLHTGRPCQTETITCPNCATTYDVSTEDPDATLSEMHEHVFTRHADYDHQRANDLLAHVTTSTRAEETKPTHRPHV